MSSLLPRQPFARFGELMSTFSPSWFVCGGWAVDAWLGHQTREHGDFDITVFHDDQRALFEHLAGWHLIAHDPNVRGSTTEPWGGRPLDLPAHIHARPGGARNLELLHTWVPSGNQPRDGLNLEIMLNERSADDWLLSREPHISLPVDRSFRRSPAGLPTAVPEILMFFKATAYWGIEGYPRPRDLADFLALVPLLPPEDLGWLRQSISTLHPAHPWLTQLTL